MCKQRGEREGSAGRNEKKNPKNKRCMWGGGTSHLLTSEKQDKERLSLQESITQLWFLTSCVPQAKLEGGITLESLAAWEHQSRDPEISSVHSPCLWLG